MSTSTALAGTFNSDPVHSSFGFAVKYQNISIFRGTLGDVTATFADGKLEGVAQVESISIRTPEQFRAHVLSPDFFDVARYPTAVYKGSFVFDGGTPVSVSGNLTLHGVTRPVDLKLNSFKCIPHPMLKRELCGADAITTIRRDEFGISAGKDYGFSMDVVLRIQVEAVANE